MANEITALSAEKQTLLALKALRRRVEELEQERREPIAVVGMSCRIPGGVHDPESFWKLLLDKRNAITEIPRNRIDLDGLFDEHPHTPGKTYSRWAGMLTSPGDFDAEFFGISPREALSADPQQRILLETSWEALEDAGIDPKTLAGTDAGVFVGITMTEYAQHYQSCVPVEGLAAHCIQGSALNAANGRLSYFYGLQGPSMAIDTACSSSLVAIDRACRSLIQRETSVAMAGGVHLLATSTNLIMMSQWGMLSPRGACRSFDDGADGFVRSEGCGVLILKRLRDAEAAGDRILAVILGSAVNQDGASSGLTVPNGVAQQELIRRALQNAGVEPWQVGYVEAHGTGTGLGDPIEAHALGAVFSEGRKRDKSLLLGSVKTNLGHLEAAAGVTGLIKVLLGLQHRYVPAQLYAQTPSSRVPWHDLPLELVTETRPWEPIEGRRIAGVSSFGFSGTNAHVIVEGVEDRRAAEIETRPAEVLVVSARTPAALRALAARYAEFLEQTEANWGEICHTAATGRTAFAQRLAVVAKNQPEAAKQLRAWLKDESIATGIHQGKLRLGEHVRVGLVLGGDLRDWDSVLGRTFDGEPVRREAWEARWKSFGTDPVVVASPGVNLQAQLAAAGVTLVVGMGSGAVNLGLPTVWLRGTADWHALTEAIAELFVRGVRIDWKEWAEGLKHRRVSLPTYAFQREHFWIEPQSAGRKASGKSTGRPLLGRKLRAAGVRGQFETDLGLTGETSWIGEHVVEGRPVFPATAHLELMLEAGTEIIGPVAIAVDDVILQAPLTVEGDRVVQTVVEPESAGRSRVRVYVESDAGAWKPVSEGWIHSFAHEVAETEHLDLQALRSKLQQKDTAHFYTDMQERGIAFGPLFRGLTALWTGEEEALGEIESTGEEPGYGLAPWRLDACLQVAGALTGNAGLYLPLSVGEFQKYDSPGERCWSHVRIRRIDAATWSADVAVAHPDGRVLARLKNMRLRRAEGMQSKARIYDEEWLPAEMSAHPSALEGHWLIVTDDKSFGEQITKRVREQGAVCSVLSARQQEPMLLDSADGEPEIAALLRKVSAEPGPLTGVVYVSGTCLLSNDSEHQPEESRDYAQALGLLQTIVREQLVPASGIWFVTRNAEQTGEPLAEVSVEGRALGALLRTAAVEFPELRTHAVDLDFSSTSEDLLRILGGTSEPEIAWRKAAAWKPRLVERKAVQPDFAERQNIEIRPSGSGVIDDLISSPVPRIAPQSHEIEIEIRAHGVNFRDVMNTLGMLPGFSQQLGGECAGVVTRAGERSELRVGDRVMAFALGSFRTFVTVAARNVARIPAGLSFSQAAALPVAYLTALLGLDRFARLRKGERILIHSAAGGLGLAAVHLARARGAEIFATAGSEEKRAYLRSLGIRNVLPSRTIDFAAEVMRLTDGRGVDVVLNSLTGDLADATLSVLSQSGRFLEVGKRDVLTKKQVAQQRPHAEHYQFDLAEEADRDPSLVPALLCELLEMLASGELSSLPVTEFHTPGEAFRFMAQARHMGKIAITSAETAPEPVVIDPAATYLITGGTGGVGLHFAEWLVKRGARHLLLLSRRGGDVSAENALARLRAEGAEVSVARVDVTDAVALKNLLAEIPKNAPLRGVLHAAGVLDDHSLLRQSFASFVKVARPKWTGAWNLHLLTRSLPLDFFVLFSSAAGLIGMPGQANYSAANRMLDGLAMWRCSRHLPALSVAWGPWSGAGMAEASKPEEFGFGRIAPDEGTMALENLLAQGATTAAVLSVISWGRFLSQRSQSASSLFVDLAAKSGSTPIVTGNVSPHAANKAEPKSSFGAALQQAGPAERSVLLAEHLRQQSVQILSLAADRAVDEDAALHDLGLDSLMAVELRNTLQVSLGRPLSPTLVLDFPTLRGLRETLLANIFGPDPSENAPGESAKNIGSLTDSEAEALLLAELERPVHAGKR
jgi:acyl transferase domain-containing protein/NADPH:quinone reductase-like Zn-dependent oxidoreductase/acyl carrier protein